MAIGAKTSGIIRLILNQGLRLAVTGIVAGIALSLVITRFLAGMLFGVTAADPLIFAAVSGLILAVTLLASVLPAFLAAGIDPIRTLRAQ